MTSKKRANTGIPLRKRKRVLNPTTPPQPTPQPQRKRRSLLASANVTTFSSAPPLRSSPTISPTSPSSSLPIIPLPSFPTTPLPSIMPCPSPSLPPISVQPPLPSPSFKVGTKRSILTLQQKPEKNAPRRKRKLNNTQPLIDDGIDDDPTLRCLEIQETTAPFVLGSPSRNRRGKMKVEDSQPNYPHEQEEEENKRKISGELKKKPAGDVLDLSQHTILPNASYVAHLPKKKTEEAVDEEDMFFDASSEIEVFTDANTELANDVMNESPSTIVSTVYPITSEPSTEPISEPPAIPESASLVLSPSEPSSPEAVVPDLLPALSKPEQTRPESGRPEGTSVQATPEVTPTRPKASSSIAPTQPTQLQSSFWDLLWRAFK